MYSHVSYHAPVANHVSTSRVPYPTLPPGFTAEGFSATNIHTNEFHANMDSCNIEEKTKNQQSRAFKATGSYSHVDDVAGGEPPSSIEEHVGCFGNDFVRCHLLRGMVRNISRGCERVISIRYAGVSSCCAITGVMEWTLSGRRFV